MSTPPPSARWRRSAPTRPGSARRWPRSTPGAEGARLLRFEFVAAGQGRGGLLTSPELAFDPKGEWLLRCDRVEFPPGGIAYRHTHQGPGCAALSPARSASRAGGGGKDYAPGQALVRERRRSGARPRLAARDHGLHPRHGAAARAPRQKLDPLCRRGRQGQAAGAALSDLYRPADRLAGKRAMTEPTKPHRRANPDRPAEDPWRRHGLLRAGRELSRGARRDVRRQLAAPRHLPPGRRRHDDGRGLWQAHRPARHLLRDARPGRLQRQRRRFTSRARIRRRSSSSSARSRAAPGGARRFRRSITARCSAPWRNGSTRSTIPRACPSW